MQPLINILIRTSNRPQHFKRLLRSIYRQTYRNVEIIVSVDNYKALDYIPKNIRKVDVTTEKIIFWDEPAFYNRYCNELMKHVPDNSFFVFVDDDDFVVNHSLEAIVPHLNENKALVVQMSRNRRKKPVNGLIEHSKIGLPCILLHSKWKNLATFGGQMDSDFWFIKEVTDKIGFDFIPVVLVECPVRSYGKI